MHEQEEDLLQRSTDKPKEASNAQEPLSKVSFRDKLISDSPTSSIDSIQKVFNHFNLEDEKENTSNHPFFIPISSSDKERLYASWEQTVMIKPLGNKIEYNYLPTYLKTFWNLSEDLNLIKLSHQSNFHKVLHQRPWFIGSQYVSISK